MGKLQILDTSGHRELTWGDSAKALAEARAAFSQAQKDGYAAFRKEGGKLSEFDPSADIVMVPRIQGG